MTKLIIHITDSKRDMYGNVYSFANIYSIASNSSITGVVQCGDNVCGCLRQAGFEWNELSVHKSELPIRQFNAATKQLPYLSQEHIVSFAKGEQHEQNTKR